MKLSESHLVAFALFIVLVWVAVCLGVLLAGLVPGLPNGVRGVMNPAVKAAPSGVN